MDTLTSILIVDDSETDRYLLKRFIKKTNLAEKVLEAENGQEAYTLFDKDPGFEPDMIFLDINMPLMNGFQFLDSFTGKHSSKKTRVIMFSSSSQSSDEEKSKTYPCVIGFITKHPKDVEEFSKTVSQFLAS